MGDLDDSNIWRSFCSKGVAFLNYKYNFQFHLQACMGELSRLIFQFANLYLGGKSFLVRHRLGSLKLITLVLGKKQQRKKEEILTGHFWLKSTLESAPPQRCYGATEFANS